jgi:hypothetical protein
MLYSLNNQSNNNLSTNIANSMEINSTRNILANKYMYSLNNNSESEIYFQEKLKSNIRTVNPNFLNTNPKSGNEYIQTIKTRTNLLQESENTTNMNQTNQSPINRIIHKIISVPLNCQDWMMTEMVNAIFKKKEKVKLKYFPNLFNVYSNTLAAPLTSEKTYLPISHRIGSFYSLSLQNFIIDATTKKIRKIYDEYFFKYKNIDFNLPASEDEEYLSLLNLYKNTEKVNLRKEIYEKYQNIILSHISDEVIAHIKEEWLVNIVKMCMRAYNLNNADAYNDLLNDCIREIIFIYKISMKKSILDYILKHPEQREKLGIPVSFRKIKEYAQESIVRPSDENLDWKRTFNHSKIKLSANLMLTSENVTKIKKYFVNIVQKTNYILIPNSWTTSGLTVFIDTQKINLDEEKKIVNEDWRKFIELTLKENVLYKDQMIIYFNSISGLMASQMRELIISSIKSYHDFIYLFKREIYYEPKKIFDNQFDPKFPFQRSFLEISIKSSSDKLSFCFSDELSDIHNKLIGVIHDVIKCSQEVDRPDNSFIKNLERKNTLWEVPVIDSQISNLIASIDLVIKENLDYINRVTDIYDPFVFVLNEAIVLEKFKNGNPKREDIKKKILYYEEKLKILRNDMPDSLYMNLIRIDCSEINNELRSSLFNYIVDLLKFVNFKNITQKQNDLTERINRLKESLDKPPIDEEGLYQSETNLESYKNDKVPAIYTEYNDFLEWVFFYFDYDKYPIFPEKGEGMGALENIIRSINISIRQISGYMDSFEAQLKEKRIGFEGTLNRRRGEYAEQLRKITSDIQHNKSIANSVLYEEGFFNALLDIEKDIENTGEFLKSLIKKEELLGAYPTDNERLEAARKDLMPLIYFVQFSCDLKEQYEGETTEIKNLDYNKLNGFIERSADIFEVHVGKVNKLRIKIEINKI